MQGHEDTENGNKVSLTSGCLLGAFLWQVLELMVFNVFIIAPDSAVDYTFHKIVDGANLGEIKKLEARAVIREASAGWRDGPAEIPGSSAKALRDSCTWAGITSATVQVGHWLTRKQFLRTSWISLSTLHCVVFLCL